MFSAKTAYAAIGTSAPVFDGRSRVGQAGPVPSAKPGHGDRRSLAMERLVIGDPLVECEQVVDRALQDQGRDPDAREELRRSSTLEEGDTSRVDHSGRVHRMVGRRDLRITFEGSF